LELNKEEESMTVNQANLKNKLAEKAKAPAKQGRTVFDLIKQMDSEIRRALPRQISAERFSRIAMTAVRNNPKLQACDPMSFIAALMQSAQLGLEPNTPLGQAYLIPYGREAQFQLGYQGMLTLAYRTGEYQSIYAHAVYENDHFEYEYGLNEKLVHVPAEDPQGEPIYYYAVYKLQNGGHGFVVMSREQIAKHRDQYSQAAKGKYSPWTTDFDSMAKKTVLKQLLKYAPKSVEFATQVAQDETIKTEIAEDMTEVQGIEVEYEVTDDQENQEQEG
jgi:recombination protein RecT